MTSISAKFNSPAWVNEKLLSYGARTSGSLEQRQSRLQRFMHLDKKIAPRTPTKTAKKISTPSAPAKPMYNQVEFSSREDDDKIYMPTEERAQGKQMPSPPLTAADYKELRIMAAAAGYDEEEDDSDYEPSDEEEDDDESLAHTEDMKVDELFGLETAIDDTWEIYISSIGKQKLRASKELSELADQLYRFHLSS